MDDMGSRIKIAREKRGFTQTQLGNMIGVSGVSIMRYEKNQREPSFKILKELANCLNVTIGYLQGYDLLNAKELVDALKKGDKSTVESLLNLNSGTIISIGEEQLPTNDEMLKMNCNAIFSCLEKMNRAGQAVAVKTVKTLSEMHEYQKKDEPVQK